MAASTGKLRFRGGCPRNPTRAFFLLPSSCAVLTSEFWFVSWFAADDTGQKAGGSKVCDSARAAVPASMDLPPPQPRHQHPFDLNSTHNLLHPSVPACSSSSASPRSATTRWGSTARRPEGTPPNSSIQCSPPTSPVPAPSMKMNATAARSAVSIRRQCGLNHGGMSACALTGLSDTIECVVCTYDQ
jgi:hypothetical protein